MRLTGGAPVCVPVPSPRSHSTCATEDTASVPVTFTLTFVCDQPDGTVVLFCGAPSSTWMTSSLHAVQPLPSVARWLRTCEPVTFAPVRLMVTSEPCQPVGAVVVSVAAVTPPAGTPGQLLGDENIEASTS